VTVLRRAAGAAAFACAAYGLILGSATPSHGQDYPTRTVKLVVPFGAGGPTDVYTRVIADELQKSLHQPFILENRPGAGTTIGTDAVAKSPSDGYTLLMVSGTQTVNESLFRRKPYELMRDLVAVAPLIDTDLVLVVHASVPAKTLGELIALAKAKPGTLNYASSGPGSNYHMAGELLKNLTGIDIVHVPYKGSTGARGDIVSGQVQMMFDSVPTMQATIKSGLVRAIATTGKTRSEILPDVPTMQEAGIPGYTATLWVGLMAPAGTPKPIVELLNREISRIQAKPEIIRDWGKQGAVPLTMTTTAFDAFMRAEIEKWSKVINANNIATVN
jgi:tripartite-type tricarboxylate transporter receptor subunit TctC